MTATALNGYNIPIEEYDEIKEIFKLYLEVVCPYIIELESLDEEFPVEILNEIRGVTTHFAKYVCYNAPDERKENLKLAKSHIKRAILDCYKYMSVSFGEFYNNFKREYRNFDLREVDNGEFIIDLSK